MVGLLRYKEQKGSSGKGGMMIIEKPVGSSYCFGCCGHVASNMELA